MTYFDAQTEIRRENEEAKAPVDSLVSLSSAAVRALSALGHVQVPCRRCSARYKERSAALPGGLNIPIWCDLPAGHEGPHKHISGHRFLKMDDTRIEMKPLPDLCQKCGVRWPCPDAEAVLKAFTS